MLHAVAYSSNCPGRLDQLQPCNNNVDDGAGVGDGDDELRTHLSKRETTSAWPKEQALCKGIKPPNETSLSINVTTTCKMETMHFHFSKRERANSGKTYYE